MPNNNNIKKHRYYADNFKDGQEEPKPAEKPKVSETRKTAPTPFTRQ